MKGSRWRGVLYGFLWYFSIFCGCLLLCCPLLPLLLFSSRAFRRAIDVVFAIWELYPVALMEIIFGTEIAINGDLVLPWEKAVFVMNHRTRLDWNFLWGGMHYATVTPSHRMKFILKDEIRHLPGPGWVMQLNGFFFIKRKWETDQERMSQLIEHFQHLNYTYQILIFPEGTDLTKKSVARSNAYADEKKLPHYDQVLHPKTTGFVFLVQKLRQLGQLNAVYDLTVGYPQTLPETEMDIMRGIFPEKVHFHVTRHSVEELPENEADLKEWLNQIWALKQNLLTQFYATGSFPSTERINRWPRPLSNSLILSVLFWTTVILFTFYLFVISSLFQIYTALVFLFFIICGLTPNGFSQIEIFWSKLKRSTKSA